MIERVGVVVPAHNEEERLGACLESLMRAASIVEVPTRVVVVLDRCTDRSRSVAHRFRAVQVIDVIAGNVGAARAAGAAELIRWAQPVGARRLWLASTDADTVVPPNWLQRQARYANLGWEAFVGTVQVDDWSAQPSAVKEQWSATYRAVDDHTHVHGANFGCTASAYLAAGGWPSVATHEDVELLRALRGRRVLRCPEPQVTTSARSDPRAQGGFGTTLNELAG